MSTFCIQVINPNTSPEMTETIASAARRIPGIFPATRAFHSRRQSIDRCFSFLPSLPPEGADNSRPDRITSFSCAP